MRAIRLFAALVAITAASATFAQAPADNDHTLQAMKDEMARAKSRLELQIPKLDKPVRPYFIEYRLLDMDIREVVAEYGALVTSAHNRNRVMNVSARVGDYKLDSSNFISEDGFRGFIGPSGTVGIDRDYDSLRQDLWIATDQAFKEAVETYSRKQAYLSSLARPQLGSGSARFFRGFPRLPANLRIEGHVLSRVHDRVPAHQRRHGSSRESFLRRDRVRAQLSRR
jgi:hypothetical protein